MARRGAPRRSACPVCARQLVPADIGLRGPAAGGGGSRAGRPAHGRDGVAGSRRGDRLGRDRLPLPTRRRGRAGRRGAVPAARRRSPPPHERRCPHPRRPRLRPAPAGRAVGRDADHRGGADVTSWIGPARYLAVANGVGAACALTAGIFQARILGPEQLGVMGIIAGITGSALTFVDVRLNDTAARAFYAVDGLAPAEAAAHRAGVVWVAALGTLVVGAVAALLAFLAGGV